MFGRSLFGQMEQDPFFVDSQNHFHQMNQMFQSPFGSGMGMLEDGRGNNHDRRRGGERQEDRGELAPFGNFGFGGFGQMFSNMDRMMQDSQRAVSQTQNNQGGHSFQQSSFYSYQNTGNGAPKIIQSSSSERRAPGGIRESRKALKDSERNLEKMSIGHHIQDRGHVVERRKNTQTGDQEEDKEYIGIEESDATGFDTEWKQKTSQAMRGLDYDRRGDRRRQRDQPKALPPSRTDHWRNDDDKASQGRRYRDRE